MLFIRRSPTEETPPSCAPRALRAGVLLGVWMSLWLAGATSAHAATDDPGSPPLAPALAPDPAPALAVVPPQVVSRVDAVFPPAALPAGAEATVVLTVTIDQAGKVSNAQVSETAGPILDDAAMVAVRQWTFEPARQGDQPVASRINIPFNFRAPRVEVLPVPPARPTEDRKQDEADTSAIEVTVRGQREPRIEERSAGDFVIDTDVLQAAPRQEGAEILRAAPGVYIGRGSGPAVAHNYVLRGFDAEHGQDIEFHVGGLPINLPSHIHGQGYADLGFLISGVTDRLSITEGVSDPRQGDFAVAGSIDLRLGVQENQRGIYARSGFGAFGSTKHSLLWAPRDAARESFGAVEVTQTDGFGENRAGQSASGIFQHRFGRGETTVRAIGILHAARSDLAGVLRRDDIDAGVVCFLCVYPFPTAEAQNAAANRLMMGVFADHEGDDGSNGQLGVWFGYDNFRIQQNFTGFIQQSRMLPQTAGRGDLVEQQNQTTSIGLVARYRSTPFRPAPFAHGTVEVGSDGRIDVIDQGQALLDASVRNQTWDRRVDASVRGMDLALWGDLDWTLAQRWHLRAGLRADTLSYVIDDRLGNFVSQSRPDDSFIVGFRRSALGLAVGPRTSLQLQALRWLSLLASYGEGYRSPQARLLEDGEKAPFSKVRSADLGVRLDRGPAFSMTAGAFYTHLSDDVAFEAEQGRLERIGATRRLGLTAHAITRPLSWLVGGLSVTYVDASLLEPPPPTSEEPQPPFARGQNLPFVPPLLVRADVGAERTLLPQDMLVAGVPLRGRAGMGFSFMSSRPLPGGVSASPVSLLDASAGLAWGVLDLTFEVFNVLDARYAAVEYNFASDWDPTAPRPRTPARHIAAGAPFSWMLSLGVRL